MERCYLSNPDVLLRIQKFQYTEGRAKGTEAFRVTNAAGLDFTVLIDRAMGIGDLFYKGERISFLTENGVVNPAYYEPEGTNWLRSFGGGFLCTCGLDQVGEPCEGHGIHGRIDNIPAHWHCKWNDTVHTYIRGAETLQLKDMTDRFVRLAKLGRGQ